MKTCSKCDVKKEDVEFPKNKFWCKACTSIYLKKYNALHKEKIAANKKEYEGLHKEEIKLNKKEYYRNDRDNFLQSQKEYQNNHKKERNSHLSLRYKNDPAYRCRTIISCAIREALKDDKLSKNGESCLNYLGYSIKDLKEHIEKQFESWMTWDNQGKYDTKNWKDNDRATWTWQIDHIIPQSILKYISMKDDNFKKCWALENLRPLSSKQNVLDGNRRNND